MDKRSTILNNLIELISAVQNNDLQSERKREEFIRKNNQIRVDIDSLNKDDTIWLQEEYTKWFEQNGRKQLVNEVKK